jgi:hypothetical protein
MLRYLLLAFIGLFALVTAQQSTSSLLSTITTSFDSIKGVDAFKSFLEKVKEETKDELFKKELTTFMDSTLLESQRQTIRMNNLFNAIFI